jgi:drug/metabolite transporter (DMT)-like permease
MDIVLSAVVAAIWGVFPFALKAASSKVPADIILAVMSFVWFASSCAYCLVTHGSNGLTETVKGLDARLLLLIGAAALIGLFVKNLIYLHVISTSKRLNVAIAVMSLSSAVSLLYGTLVLKYHVNTRAIVGICITAGGVAVMLHSSDPIL